MKTFLYLLCLFCLGWCVCNCSRVQSYSDVPEIGFVSLSFENVTTALGTDRMAVLVFSFVDGDGDIGVRSRSHQDSISKIHYTWQKKLTGGTYEPYKFPKTGTTDSTAIPYNSVMNKDEAQNKTLKGTIQIALYAPDKPQDVDTMRIEYFIFDRAGNKSNVDKTPDFSILNTSDTIIRAKK